MLRPKSPQASFYGAYLYDRIVPQDHLLRKINQVVDFSFIHDLVKDRYTPDFGRPAEDPEFMLRLCLLQYLYGDSDRSTRAVQTQDYFCSLPLTTKEMYLYPVGHIPSACSPMLKLWETCGLYNLWEGMC